MVKDWSAPSLTVTTPAVPAGVMVPLVPWVTVMEWVIIENVAAILWSPVTLLNVYEVAGVTEPPSTVRVATW